MQAWKDYQEQHKDRFLNELLDLLRIPSISAKSENKADMVAVSYTHLTLPTTPYV